MKKRILLIGFLLIVFSITTLIFFAKGVKAQLRCACQGNVVCCLSMEWQCTCTLPYPCRLPQQNGVNGWSCEYVCVTGYGACEGVIGGGQFSKPCGPVCPASEVISSTCAWEAGCEGVTPAPTPTPTPPPLPPGCTCGGWVDRGCRPDKCSSPNLHRYTRTCTPAGCATEATCEYDPACLGPAPPPTPTSGPGPGPGEPSCTITPSPLSVRVNEGRTSRFEAQVSYQNATGVNRVEFSSSNTPIATVNPSSDSSSPYETIVTGVAQGSATLFVDAFLAPSGGCTTSVPITVTLPAAWFQTQGGDVHSQGNLSSNIPPTATNPNFSLELNNYPGIISHQSFGGAYFGEGYPSNNQAGHWLAESKYEGKPYSSFEFFKKKYAMQMIEENFDGSLPQADGVYYTKSSKTLSGNWTVPASRWLVILVEGEVTIPNDIKVNEGGFLAIASSGNIIFDNTITKAQGIFVADGKIDTGSGAATFEGQGVFAASEFKLNRDFQDQRNKTTPVETFIARPDFVMSSYKNADNNLWWFYQKWQELAP